MLRDADGDLFFGFCGVRCYVPDDDPHAEGIAAGVLRRFRERLAAELAKDKPAASHKPANYPYTTMLEFTYSKKITDLNSKADTSLLGVRLGRLCIENDVPATTVAKRLNVSRSTVYAWFCGKVGVSKHLQKAVIDFCREMTDPSGPPSKA